MSSTESHILQSTKVEKVEETSSSTQPTAEERVHSSPRDRLVRWWTPWNDALKQTLPIYIVLHVAFFLFTCLATLYQVGDFSAKNMPISTLWEIWSRKDTGHFIRIAERGYTDWWRTAFFPLFPLMERYFSFFAKNAYFAGLIISNVATLVMLVVLYRLVKEDFDAKVASRTILYISIFPTAFFFVAAYNESLFLAFALLSFYNMRRGRWWWAGLFGFFAALTRSSGLFLILPFCYEYLRQQQFNLKQIRWNVLAGAAIPLAVALFAFYCWYRFGNPLAFATAQGHWGRYQVIPGYNLWLSWVEMSRAHGVLNFRVLRNLTDVVPDVFVGIVLILGLVGPWRLPRELMAYSVLAWAIYLFVQTAPAAGAFPVKAIARHMLEVFPAFIIMARIGVKHRTAHLAYQWISAMLLFYLLSIFLSYRWVI